ncbi:MAG: thioredoxin domain-containing protein [Actinomycetota bacterium]
MTRVANERNRLGSQTSPYLLQHADNPVDWEPWDDRALTRAAAEDKPLLVSIGYAACHWCHVMERESFEDIATATLMNEHFVCIKVDREERPDLDAIYMDAVQATTGHGGWPLTAFCTPDGAPFFTGTYFPREDRPPMPSFTRVLTAIAEGWQDRRDELVAQGRAIVEAIGGASTVTGSDAPLSTDLLTGAGEQLQRAFDERWGGFGGAPKFPQPMTLELLLRLEDRGDDEARTMLTTTLERMAAGGMYDQIGGGFSRYSVDERWHVPHFEKMLYDNAQLARLYTHAWERTGVADFRRVATETLEYLLRELRHADGGFFSSQDADSEGVEGAFFAWSWDELLEHTTEAAAVALGATREGNWPEGGSELNVLWRPQTLTDVAERSELSVERVERELAEAKSALFAARETRVHPATDDKVLAGWNGLAISALAEAGRAFDEPRYVHAASRTATFVLANLRSEDGRLLRSWRDGDARIPAFSDDHALLADGLLTLYEATFDTAWFARARELADALLELFLDEERGGFYQSGRDADALVLRPKEVMDNAVPSGNSVAATVLQRLALFTGETRYEDAAVGALRLVRDQMQQWPTGFGQALCAADLHLSRAPEIAIVGDLAADDTLALIAAVSEGFAPNRVLAVAEPGDRTAQRTIALLQDRPPIDGRATAYVCERFACRLPVTDPIALRAQLKS